MISLGNIPKNFSGWEVGDRYEIVKQVGSGSYGYVVQAKDKKNNNEKVAIKKFCGVFDDLIDGKRILREIVLLRMLKHPNLVNLIEMIQLKNEKNFNEIYMVMEYCKSDLKKLFKSAIHLTEQHINQLLYHMLISLKYLHSADVLHRDLKPANVLINEDCTVKICDFGLARSVEGIEGAHASKKQQPQLSQEQPKPKEKVIEVQPVSSKPASTMPVQIQPLQKSKAIKGNKQKQLTSHVVTRWYRAPEVILLEKDYSGAIDMWSVGCIFC
eukprot:TRINITY_DN4036_c0_g1_i1.p2 TRINITY_DN4036_c0_g1~~TRINITY_DN4036_c0_g1_i1.p2  ORF type:complete len:270 (-),score=41.29 TRINITY_DN4036_c0_g1_i1:587-1396(-)